MCKSGHARSLLAALLLLVASATSVFAGAVPGLHDRNESVPLIVLYGGSTPPAKANHRYEVRVLSFSGQGIKGVRVQPIYRWRLPQKIETTNQDGLCSVSVASSVLRLEIKTDDVWINLPGQSLMFPLTVFLEDSTGDRQDKPAGMSVNTDDVVAKSGKDTKKLVEVTTGQMPPNEDESKGNAIRVLDMKGAGLKDVAVEAWYVSVREPSRFSTNADGIASVKVGTGAICIDLGVAQIDLRRKSIRFPIEIRVARSEKR